MMPTKNQHSNSARIQQSIRETYLGKRDQSKGNPDYFSKSTLTQNNLSKLILKAQNREPSEKETSKLTSTQRLLHKIVSMDKTQNKFNIPSMRATKIRKPKKVTMTQQIPRKVLLDNKFLGEIRLGEKVDKKWQIIKIRDPRIWKFHLGSSSNNNHSDTTSKVLTMAMKRPNKLYGDSFKTGNMSLYHLSPGLKRLGSLRNLCLNLKGISSEGLKSLCGGLKRLTSLQNISLRFTDSRISEEEIERLGHCLQRFPHLKELSLGFIGCAEVSQEGFMCLGDSLKRLRQIENPGLELSSCVNMTDSGIYALKDWLKNLFSLRSLSLNLSNLQSFTNEGMAYLGEVLNNHGKNLKKIHFRFDLCPNVSNRGLFDLSQGIKKLTLLEDIHLYFSEGSEIGGLGVSAISRALRELKSLKNIDLNLSGQKALGENSYFCREAGSSIGKNLHLKIRLGDQELHHLRQNLLESFPFQTLNLCFSNCSKLTDAGLKDFGGRLGKFIALQNLQLKFMNCEGVTSQGFLVICEGLQRLNSLQNFSLSVVKPSQLLSGFGIYGLCEILKVFSRLRSFRLSCDFKQLSLKGLRALCEALNGSDSLERVFLRSNRLVGLKVIEVSLGGQLEIKESLSEVISRFVNIELKSDEKEKALLEIFEGIRKKK